MKKLEHARATLVEIEAKVGALQGKRRARLLAGDAADLVGKFDDEIGTLQRAARIEVDRIALLEVEAKRVENEALNKRRATLRDRFAKRLAEADADAVELQQTVARLVVLFRKIIDRRETARAAWPISDSHLNAAAGALEGAALSGSAVKALLSYEFYRCSADPFMGGVPGERRQQSLPGAVSPRIDQQLDPSKIKPFADALKQASAFAIEAMQTQLDPLRALNVGEAVASVDGERTDKEQKLAALLKQQAQAAEDTSEAGERRYMEIVAELARLSAEPQGAIK